MFGQKFKYSFSLRKKVFTFLLRTTNRCVKELASRETRRRGLFLLLTVNKVNEFHLLDRMSEIFTDFPDA